MFHFGEKSPLSRPHRGMSTTQASRSRRPAGTPTGGQFAPEAHAEPEVTLAPPPPLHERERGVFEVVNTTVEHLEDETDGGITISRAAIYPGGISHLRAETGLVSLAVERASGGQEAIEDTLRFIAAHRFGDANGDKVTVLVRSGVGSVDAIEGRLTMSNDRIAIMQKGSSTKGFYLDRGLTVLAIRRGYGHAPEMAAWYRNGAADLPHLEPATFDDIPDVSGVDDEPPSEIAAAFVLAHPGFDESSDGRGVVFFATDRDAENGIVNGYMACPSGSGLFSEHGSMYERDIKAWGGRVSTYQAGSLTFSDAIRLAEEAETDQPDAVWRAIA